MRKADGTEHVSRGCYKSEEHRQFMCNKEESQNTDQKEGHVRGLPGGVRYSVECCQEDFCNVGSYPVLQDYTTSKTINISLTFTNFLIQSLHFTSFFTHFN